MAAIEVMQEEYETERWTKEMRFVALVFCQDQLCSFPQRKLLGSPGASGSDSQGWWILMCT